MLDDVFVRLHRDGLHPSLQLQQLSPAFDKGRVSDCTHALFAHQPNCSFQRRCTPWLGPLQLTYSVRFRGSVAAATAEVR